MDGRALAVAEEATLAVAEEATLAVAEERALIERARAGDSAAFSALVRRYQEMALGYALALLRDYHLAQDVTQEALFIAYRSLASLEDEARFPAWLRGIVRFQCGRVLRRRRLDLVSLDQACELAMSLPDPAQRLEVREGFHRILAAINALPQAQREAAMLFYIKDYSQRDVAAFLELPVTTVNNRLHAARLRLKERLLIMSKKVGCVRWVDGPVVDVQFDPANTPLMLSALTASDEARQHEYALQVVQRMNDGVVRCLARDNGVTPGMAVADMGGPMIAPMDADMLARAITLLGMDASGASARPEILETGIKVIDLLCPYPKGGNVGVFGPSGAGRIVLNAEVLRNVARDGAGVAMFAFVHTEVEARCWYDNPDEAPRPQGASRMICLPIENPIDAGSPSVLLASSLLDARTYLSANLGRSGIWPAVDPLLSTSRLLDPAIVGQEHYDVACAIRHLLRRYRTMQEGKPDGKPRLLTAADMTLIARARKLQRFFMQPFFVAEAFSGRPGQYVPLTETLRACKALLAGEYDRVPEESFVWSGGIDQVLARTA